MQVLAYKKNRDISGVSVFLPDFVANDVLDIDFAKLKSLGVKHVIFDLDQTLLRAYARHFEAEVIVQIQELQSKKMFESIAIMTNNHLSLRKLSKVLDVRTFQPYWNGMRMVRKPNPRFFQKVLQELGADPAQTVMIGDKIRSDVAGGNRAGMRTILVKPRGRDYWFNAIILARLRESRKFRKALNQLTKDKKK